MDFRFGNFSNAEAPRMVIGDRPRDLRESIEKRLRTYRSSVEHGHTVPAIETLEKLDRALSVPLDRLFYRGKER